MDPGSSRKRKHCESSKRSDDGDGKTRHTLAVTTHKVVSKPRKRAKIPKRVSRKAFYERFELFG